MKLWCDTETRSAKALAHGSWAYAEQAEVLLFTWAVDDGPVDLWDLTVDPAIPQRLARSLAAADEIWFSNGGGFDWPVLSYTRPDIYTLMPQEKWRDVMIQAYSHALPGSLGKLGKVLGLPDDLAKDKRGKALINLFCKPRKDGGWNTRLTHPVEWAEFCEYAKQDIVVMRECSRRMPMWNYREHDVRLWLTDWRTNARGIGVDTELARTAVDTARDVRRDLSAEMAEATGDAVGSATQRDALLKYLLAEHGLELEDLTKSTVADLLEDDELDPAARHLLELRQQASLNSPAKFRRVLNGANSDDRIRGCMQFRGAGRTGRAAHRLLQPGNMARPKASPEHIEDMIEFVKAGDLQLFHPKPMEALRDMVRGVIVARPGRKLVVADLSNIEGRMMAWLAGEEWKLRAFREFDAGHGHDLYILAYAKSFAVDPATVPKKGLERQIGKVQELMMQYEGGVGAFVTGAMTYRIDLEAMSEQAWPTIPEWAKEGAAKFLEWKHSQVPGKTKDLEAARTEARLGLSERVFLTCDALKRLWRAAHPEVAGFWADIKEALTMAVNRPGETFPCRRVKFRRDGNWLRIGLPSGRALCYPEPKIDEDGQFSYSGVDQRTRKWQRVKSYSGKLAENIVQAAAADQMFMPAPHIEAAGYLPVLHVHDEWVTETPDSDEFTPDALGAVMCMDLGWNKGLPLAAAGYEAARYRKD